MLIITQTALELGFLYALVAMALFLSYRILDIADMTTDGCFVLGAAVSVSLTTAGHPILAIPAAMLAGACAGFATAFLQTRLGVPSILAGIVTNTGLYTVNLMAMGWKANQSLLGGSTIFTLLRDTGIGGDWYELLLAAAVTILAGALLLGVPVALLTAVYLAFFCPKGLYRVLKPAVELLAGIPSVVYGFFGIVVLVPAVRALGERWDGSGNAMLTASILLAMMILPTIIGVVEPALRAVPTSDYEGALALGATHERSVYTAVVPAAKSGILAGIVLGVGRAMGETMAVIMVAGNQPRMPKGILQGVRTLTGNIVIEMGYATGLHREALIATGVVLFVFILLINLCFSALKRGKKA